MNELEVSLDEYSVVIGMEVLLGSDGETDGGILALRHSPFMFILLLYESLPHFSICTIGRRR